MKKCSIFFSLFLFRVIIFAQPPALFIKSIITIHGDYMHGDISSLPVVFIHGTFISDNSLITNHGELQVTGDVFFYETILQDSGQWVFLGGTVSNPNNYNQSIQVVTGNFSENNQFSSTVIAKPVWTPEKNSRVVLGSNLFTKNLTLLSGIITTDTADHADAGELYQNVLFVTDPDMTSIIGYSTEIGSVDRYVVGKLSRAINSTENYFFPVGVEPDHNIGGMNAFSISIKPKNTPSTISVLGYLEKSNLYSIGNNGVIYCDVGTVSSNGNFPDPFSTCIGGPDGIVDKIIMSQHQEYQWNISSTYDSLLYDIEVFPTDNCKASAMGDFVPSSCQEPFSDMQMMWLAHNGVPGGTNVESVVLNNEQSGFTICIPNNPYVLFNQVGFSKFRLHGAVITGTILPVELISFQIIPINNQYFGLSWVTDSEVNCKEFVLQKSIDGKKFIDISTISGNGTTNIQHVYHYYDYDVVLNKNYYYRLKTVDFDHSYQFSSVVTGKLLDNTSVLFFPNPTHGLVFSDSYNFDQILIYDSFGVLIKVLNKKQSIDISEFSSGMYTFYILKDGNYTYQKIIKI